MAATKTKTDLINEALGNLGVLAAGQTPSAEDSTKVNEHIDPLVAELDARQIVTVDDIESIPAEWFLPLGILLADAAALKFGLAGVPSTPSNPNPVDTAILRLREATYGRPTGEPLRGEYF